MSSTWRPTQVQLDDAVEALRSAHVASKLDDVASAYELLASLNELGWTLVRTDALDMIEALVNA